MLGTPCIRRYRLLSGPVNRVDAVSGENATGADNQQETERDPQRLYAKPALRSGEDTVRASWRHEESGRNDLATHSGSQLDWGVTKLPKVAKFLVG